MTQWRQTIDLSDLWESYENDLLTVSALSASVSTRLADANVPDDIVVRFEDLDDVDDFDDAMSYLYDWADAERVWVKTTL